MWRLQTCLLMPRWWSHPFSGLECSGESEGSLSHSHGQVFLCLWCWSMRWLQSCRDVGKWLSSLPVCKTVKKSSFLGLLSSVLRGHNTDTVHAQDSWPNLFIYWKPMPVEAMEHGDSPQKASICHSPWPSKPCKRCFCTQEQQTDPHQVQIPGSELDICTSREKEKQEAAEVRICRGRQW